MNRQMPISNEQLVAVIEHNSEVMGDVLASMNDLRGDLKGEADVRKRHIKVLAITVIFDLLLSCAFIGVGYRLHYDEIDARRSSCEQTNEARVGVKHAFDTLVNVVEQELPAKTPQGQEQIEEIRKQLQEELSKSEPLLRC